MAVRNPTTWTQYIDEKAMLQRSQIITTQPTNVVNDQVFTLDAEMLVASYCWFPWHIVNVPGGFAFALYRTLYLRSKDMCDAASVTNNEIQHAVCWYAWVDNAATRYSIRIASTAVASSNIDVSVSGPAGDLTPAWRGFGTGNIKTNDIEDTLSVYVQQDTEGGDLYIAGFGIFAVET